MGKGEAMEYYEYDETDESDVFIVETDAPHDDGGMPLP